MRPALSAILLILLALLVLAPAVSGAIASSVAKVTTATTPQFVVVQTYVVVTKMPILTTVTTNTYSPGAVVIQSNPSGAEIWIGGNDLGQITPYSIPVTAGVAAPAPYQITLKYPGYQDYSQTVTPRLKETQTITAQLVPLPTTRTTVVTSAPATSVPTTQPPPGTTRQAPSRISVPALHQQTTLVPVILNGTPAPADVIPSASAHTPRRVPGFEAAAAGSALGCILFLKRSG